MKETNSPSWISSQSVQTPQAKSSRNKEKLYFKFDSEVPSVQIERRKTIIIIRKVKKTFEWKWKETNEKNVNSFFILHMRPLLFTPRMDSFMTCSRTYDTLVLIFRLIILNRFY